MVLDLFARFDSDLMRKHRKNFSTALMTKRSEVDLLEETPVLDMLQDVAHHTRRGILDRDMVRSAFGWWVNGYYRAVTTPTNLLVKVREEKKSPSFYSEFEWLYQHVTRPEKDESRELTSAFQEPAVFLPGEMSIRVDEKASSTS